MYADTLFTLCSERKQRICIHTLFTYVMLSKIAPGWRGEDELLNKVVILVFFAHKKHSRSFVKLRLNHWCDMDYFNVVFLTTFLDLDIVLGSLLSMEGQRALRIHQKYLNMCSEDERMSYRFGTTEGWVMTEYSFLGELSLKLMLKTVHGDSGRRLHFFP